jgi:hypothetical protein
MRLASNRLAVAGFTTTILPPSPVPASGPPALHLRAVLAPRNEPLSVPLYWTVAAEDKPGKALFRAWSANPVVPVAPGRYVVEVESGLARARESVLVRENRPAAVALRLDAGTVRARAVAESTGAPLPGAIFTIAAGAAADGPPLAVFGAGEAAPLLQAGRYWVRADLGALRSQPRAFDVEAGKPTAIDVPFKVGRLELAIEARNGGVAPLEPPVFVVTKDDPPHGKREVARSAGARARFVLPPDVYYVMARQGGVVARERVEIGSGDRVEVKLAVAARAGRLGLGSTVVAPPGAGGELVSYAVRRLDEPQEEIVTSRPAPVLDLPKGRYRVEGRYGLTNARSAREVDLAAGQTLHVSLELRIAVLRMRIAGRAATDATWEVRDESGRIVWTSAEAETVATLEAGRYLVAMTTPERREQRKLDLRAGSVELVELSGR